MGIFDFLQRKESVTRKAMVIGQVGSPRNTERNYKAMAAEGYQSNVIVYRCISLVAQCAANVGWELYRKTSTGLEEVNESPLMDLLCSPNPTIGKKQFYENVYAYLLMSGNTYIELNNKRGMELWNVRPDYMKVVPGAYGVPAAYQFQADNGEMVRFEVDQKTGRSQIMQAKLFNPTNNWYGMSPMEAAFLAVDQHNNAGRWNLSLLQREARPSGALMVEMSEMNPAGKLTDEQFTNMKSQIDDLYSGAKNAGRPMLLEGGLTWQQMSMGFKDMDWLNAKNLSSREIALAFGVPPMMLNISGDNTYANLKEARFAFYEETIIPLVCFMRDELQRWLVPLFGDDLELHYDADSIDALILKRDMKFETANKAKEFLTVNERRELVGYEPLDGGDELPGSGGMFGADLNDEPTDSEDEPDAETEEDIEPEQDSEQGQADDELEDEEDEDEKSLHADSLFEELKLVNLITRNQKRKSARAQMRRRDYLAKSFEMDLEDVFEKLNKSMGKITTTQQKLAEMQAAGIIADHKDDFEVVFRKHLKRTALEFGRPILSAAKAYANNIETKREEWFYSWLGGFVESHTAENVSQIQGTTMKRARDKIKEVVQRGIEQGDTNIAIGKELEADLNMLTAGRARTIARTEVAIASQTGSLEAAKTMQIPGLRKQWISIEDDRTRPGDDSHDTAVPNHVVMNERTVGLDEKFNVPPGDQMDGPGDPSASVGNLVNCRCALIYITPNS